MKGLPYEVAQELPKWRRKHKHLYSAELQGELYVFRPLTWAEFKELTELQSAKPASFENIVEAGLLWPKPLPQDVLAGVVHTLFQTILEVSGFSNQEALNSGLSWARHTVSHSVDYLAMAMICRAFPYTPDDLESKPFLEIMTLLAMAEKALDAQLQVGEPDEQRSPTDPREVKRQRRDAARERMGSWVPQPGRPGPPLPVITQEQEAFEMPGPPERPTLSKSDLIKPMDKPDFNRENAEMGGW